jgi:hypothetical protein
MRPLNSTTVTFPASRCVACNDILSGIYDFNFTSAQNHRAAAKRSDAVLPGMARSHSTPVRRISRSFSSDAKLARLGLEFYQGVTRKLLGEDADFAGCQGRGKRSIGTGSTALGKRSEAERINEQATLMGWRDLSRG